MRTRKHTGSLQFVNTVVSTAGSSQPCKNNPSEKVRSSGWTSPSTTQKAGLKFVSTAVTHNQAQPKAFECCAGVLLHGLLTGICVHEARGATVNTRKHSYLQTSPDHTVNTVSRSPEHVNTITRTQCLRVSKYTYIYIYIYIYGE